VRVLPLAAGRNEGGLYFSYFLGFQIIAWAPKKNDKNSGKKRFVPPPLAHWGRCLVFF
jgi:hypothetical protein